MSCDYPGLAASLLRCMPHAKCGQDPKELQAPSGSSAPPGRAWVRDRLVVRLRIRGQGRGRIGDGGRVRVMVWYTLFDFW